MIALLVPAVQKVREAAARTQCVNNLKQIGLALHNYHDTNKTFPYGGSGDGDYVWGAGSNTGLSWNNWRVLILPYIEQAALFNNIQTGMAGKTDFIGAASVGDAWQTAFAGLSAQSQVVPNYQCPSDPNYGQNKQWNSTSAWWLITSSTNGAFASYFGCSGADAIGSNCGIAGSSNCYNTGMGHSSQSTTGSSGIFALRNFRTKISHITDGTSNTIAVGEQRTVDLAGQEQLSLGIPRLWMEPFSVMSTVWGINSFSWPAGYYGAGFGSFHTGGSNFLFADGSVRFLSQSINIVDFTRMGTKAGGEVFADPG